MVLTFKLADDVVSSLKNVLLARGFVEFVDHHHAPNSWNFQWKTTRYTDREARGGGAEDEHAATYRKGRSGGSSSSNRNGAVVAGEIGATATAHMPIHKRQKINHFQKTSGICKKDDLARNLRRMVRTWGSVYLFFPETFILPRELNELKAAMEREDEDATRSSRESTKWICKPSSSSQGKNIFIVSKIDEISIDCSFVVQRYIHNPMLIGGYKYDLRIYVLVTCFRPLRVYMYREGLVRFSSSPYDAADVSNLFAHLTNASINKQSPDANRTKEVIGEGCKWTIKRWFQHLESVGINPYTLWERIKDIVILTLIPIVPDVPDNKRSFELFGFDIMVDQQFKPWIIEVNASPAIAISGKQDTDVKIPLLNDLLDAVGFPAAACLAQTSSSDNLLPPNHSEYDPQAMNRANIAAVSAAYAAAAPANAQDNDADEAGDLNPASTRSHAMNQANCKDRVQRMPRVARLQTQKGREVAAATVSGPAKAVTALPRQIRRPVAAVVPSPSPRTSITPSRIPLPRRTTAGESDPQPASRSASVSVSVLARNPATAKRTLTRANVPPSNSGRAARQARSTLTPITPDPSHADCVAAAVAATSAAASSLAAAAAPIPAPTDGCSAPLLIGDFERIFPFNSSTADAADSLAPSAHNKQSTASRSASSSNAQPMAQQFQHFTRTTIQQVKLRIRAREKVEAEQSRLRQEAIDTGSNHVPPLRASFTPTSDIPSPWTSATIEAAVNAAKAAARAERARLGITQLQPERNQHQDDDNDADDGTMKDDAKGVEEALAKQQGQCHDEQLAPSIPDEQKQEGLTAAA